MSEKERKYQTHYAEIDLANIIADMFRQLETPEGKRFLVSHILDDTVMIQINSKTFIINVAQKSKLS